ncbi:MAG: efflux RND transporter periplasmic adaptor subunit [Myxococcales bacterium]|nr:MAG: efflux RND transporter periplasmic adaptor subunit [Myxococcales bacterium]
MKTIWIIGFASVLSFCARGKKEQPQTQKAKMADQAKKTIYDWYLIRKANTTSVFEAPAVVRAPHASAGIALAYRGRITALHATVGAKVKKGDAVLDVLCPEVLDAAAVYLSAMQRSVVYKARSERLETLREEGIVDQSRVLEQQKSQAELGIDTKRAAAVLRASGISPDAAKSLLAKGSLTLRAPISGVLTELSARIGEIPDLGSNKPLARIVGESKGRVEVRVLGGFPKADSLSFIDNAGKILALNPEAISQVQSADGTWLLWYEFAKEAVFADGLRGRVRINSAVQVFEIPQSMVAEQSGKITVLRDRNNKESHIEIEVIASTDYNAFIRGPLAVGDRIALVQEASRAGAGAARAVQQTGAGAARALERGSQDD